MKVEVEDFGCLPSGDVIKKIIVTNSRGIQVVLTNYGASLIGLVCPDRDGVFDDILLGFDTLEEYLENRFFGATIGRCANRIAKGKFSIDGKNYSLDCNNGSNHLHGGNEGFDKKVWSLTQRDDGIEFNLISPDGDQGYPGELTATSIYQLNEQDELTMKLIAHVDKDSTVINMTNHAFINLAGQTKDANILDHIVEINGRHYLPTNDMIPTGEIKEVDKVFSFYKESRKPIGKDIALVEGGYDHNYCLEKSGDAFCARVHHEHSGRKLEIYTDQPGVQFYTGNFLNVTGKNNKRYIARSGFCLEPQNYPDAINQTNFPSPLLKPGEKYERFIKWKLSVG